MTRAFFIGAFLMLMIAGFAQDLTGLYDYERKEMSVKVVKSIEHDSLIRFEKVVLNGFDYPIPFYHYSNMRNNYKAYAILIHGLGGNKDYWVYPSEPYLDYTTNLTRVKDELLDLGLSLIIVDARFHGERSYELGFRDPGNLPPMLSRNPEDAEIFYDLYVSSIKEIFLIMDYIEKDNGESGLSFNLIGYSMGAAFSLILNDIDDRFNCVVACVPPLSRPFSELEEFNWSEELSNKLRAISPLYSVRDQNAPVALLMGRDDFFIPEQEAKDFYERLTLEEKVLKFYDSGHELPSAYIDDLIEWVSRYNKR